MTAVNLRGWVSGMLHGKLQPSSGVQPHCSVGDCNPGPTPPALLTSVPSTVHVNPPLREPTIMSNALHRVLSPTNLVLGCGRTVCGPTTRPTSWHHVKCGNLNGGRCGTSASTPVLWQILVSPSLSHNKFLDQLCNIQVR